MSEIAKRITDKRVLRLLRKFLTVGILENGLTSPADKGTGQGSPISPLLSNIMLDLLDKELEQRGHKYCRFADDCNVYVHSKRAGDRVMKSLVAFITKKLKLKVNEQKSGVDKVYRRQFLGFSFTSGKMPKRRISPKAINKFKEKVQKLTLASKGMCMENVINQLSKYIKGWLAYFKHCETPHTLADLESWMRRKLRCAYWRQWKNGENRAKQLRKLGVGKNLATQTAGTNKGPWHSSMSPALSIALSNAYFENLGLPRLVCKR
jgi:RNA-directed DNA polymerase